MADDLVLVVDGGSSSLRFHLVDSQGRVRTTVRRPWSYQVETQASDISRAFDADACWRSACAGISEAIATRRSTDRISAVAVTSQRQSLVFLDEDLRVVYAGPNTDLRAFFDGSALDLEHGPLIYRTTGHRPTFMMAAGKLRWFQGHLPEEYKRIAHVLTLADWLCFKLSGQLGVEPTLASGSGLVDIRSRTWPTGMFEQLDIECPLPALREFWEPPASVSSSELRELNGVPVVVAGADTQCGLIGVGCVEAGSAGIIAGWSGTVQLLVPEPITSPEMKTWTECFQVPEVWALESSAGDIGNSYRWLAETMFGDGDEVYQEMDRLSAEAVAGSDGASAFLGSGAMDVSAVRMQLGGFVFPVPMTLGGPTRGQIVRATLESFGYALRSNLEQAEDVAGVSARRIGLGGGLTRGETTVRIFADVIGRQVEVLPEPDVTAVGAALVARTAIGQFSSLSEAGQSARERCITVLPDARASAGYQQGYQAWSEMQRNLGEMLL